jgi:hypothetical protein
MTGLTPVGDAPDADWPPSDRRVMAEAALERLNDFALSPAPG